MSADVGNHQLNFADPGQQVVTPNRTASTPQGKLTRSDEKLAQANTNVMVPGPPTMLPPVFIPGTSENNDVVHSMIEGFQALGDATASIFNA